MSARQGMFRVAKAIKILGHLVGWLIVAAFIAFAVMGNENKLVVAGIGLVIGAAIIAAGHGLAWIIEGFAPES